LLLTTHDDDDDDDDEALLSSSPPRRARDATALSNKNTPLSSRPSTKDRECNNNHS